MQLMGYEFQKIVSIFFRRVVEMTRGKGAKVATFESTYGNRLSRLGKYELVV